MPWYSKLAERQGMWLERGFFMFSKVEKICTMGFFCFFSVVPVQAFASGFVKNSGAHYTKFSYAWTTQDINQGSADGFKEKRGAYTLYVEAGLPTPFKLQVSAAATLKKIAREGKDAKGTGTDSFTSQGLADSTVGLKAAVYEGSLFQESFPLFFALAARGDVTLPTTKKAFRVGNESERARQAPASRTFLVAPLGDGKYATTLGLGFSVSAQGVWLSAEHLQKQSWEAQFADRTLSSQLGFGLPFNSWLQVGFENNAKQVAAAETEGTIAQRQLQTSNKFSSGVGLTVWDGLALEAGFERNLKGFNNKIKAHTGYTVGLSYRSL